MLKIKKTEKKAILLLIITTLLFGSILFANLSKKGVYIFWLLSLGIALILNALFFKIKKISITLFDISALLFTIYITLNFSILSNQNFMLYFFWVYIGYIICFFLFQSLFSSNKYTTTNILLIILDIFKYLVLIEAIIGLLQYFNILVTKHHNFKILGTFNSSPNQLACLLSFGFVIAFFRIFVVSYKNKVLKISNWLTIIVIGIVILLTKARTSWLAMIVGASFLIVSSKLFISWFKKQRQFIRISLIASLITLLFSAVLFSYKLKPESAYSRYFISKINLTQIAKKPIFGHGLYTFSKNYNIAKSEYFLKENRPWNEVKAGSFAFGPFNDYLRVLNELGLVGFILLLIPIIILFKNKKQTPNTKISWAILSMLSIFAMFSYPIHIPHVITLSFIAITIIRKEINETTFIKIKSPLIMSCINLLSFSFGVFYIFIGSHKLIAQKKINNYQNNKEIINNKEVIKELYSNYNQFHYSKFYLGKDLYEKGYKQEGIFYMEQGFDEFPRPYYGEYLGKIYRLSFNYKRAEEIFKFNIGNEPFRFKHLNSLANLMFFSNRIDEFLNLHQKIVDMPAKIPSNEVEKLKKKSKKYIEYYKKFSGLNKHIKGSLSIEQSINSKIFNRKINYKIYLPSLKYIKGRLPVLYVVDGQQYLKETEIVKKTDSLINNNIINPISIIFIDPRDADNPKINRRQEYFLCNPLYIDFFNKELLPKCEWLFPVSKEREQRGMLGHSFGGLFAAYLGHKASDKFKNIVMQSPAFAPCKDIYGLYNSVNLLSPKIYLSYGTGNDTERQDLPMIEILKNKNYELKINRVEKADHNWDLWKNEIDNILLYFYKPH